MNVNYLSVREMKDGSGMNGDETENNKVIRKERRRIVRRLSHGKSMEKQEGNGG
jgi:hypothetical protein